MSTHYRFDNPVPFAELREAVESNKVPLVSIDHTWRDDDTGDPANLDEHLPLTDGHSFLHAFTGDGSDSVIVRYGGNDPQPILEALEEHFDEAILSEHDEAYFDDNSEAPRVQER